MIVLKVRELIRLGFLKFLPLLRTFASYPWSYPFSQSKKYDQLVSILLTRSKERELFFP